MHPDCKDISVHMRDFGLGILAQAQKNALYWDYSDLLPRGVFAIMQASHASEILIKAAIAQEHPFLIFSQIPKSKATDDELLGIRDLIQRGKTLQYSELPERLWATTGYNLKEIDTFQKFGKLRNAIQHLAVPNRDLEKHAVEFIYKIIDPLIGDFWDLNAIEYCAVDSHEDDIVEALVRQGIISFRYPKRLDSRVKKVLN